MYQMYNPSNENYINDPTGKNKPPNINMPNYPTFPNNNICPNNYNSNNNPPYYYINNNNNYPPLGYNSPLPIKNNKLYPNISNLDITENNSYLNNNNNNYNNDNNYDNHNNNNYNDEGYYSEYDVNYDKSVYGINNNPYANDKIEDEESKNIIEVLVEKLFSIFSPFKKSRKLKKYKKKIKKETVDINATLKRLENTDRIPFLYFGDIVNHSVYQLYKYIEITNKVRDLNFMKQWLVDSSIRRKWYDEINQMNDEYLLKGKKTYDDNIRPSFKDKWYNELKMAVKDYATSVEFECQCGVIQFPDAVWDVLGCMVFKQFMGVDVNSSLVCQIDHIFPFSRIKGGASEFQNLCVLSKTVNSVARKGKYHLFELYDDDKVNGLITGCVVRHIIVSFFNQNIPKNVNKKSPNFKKILEDTTNKFLISNNIPSDRIGSVEAFPDPTNNVHIIRVKFSSTGKPLKSKEKKDNKDKTNNKDKKDKVNTTKDKKDKTNNKDNKNNKTNNKDNNNKTSNKDNNNKTNSKGKNDKMNNTDKNDKKDKPVKQTKQSKS